MNSSKPYKYDIVMFTHDRKIDRRILLEAASLRRFGKSVAIVAMPYEHAEESDPADAFRLDKLSSEISYKNRSLVAGYYYLRKLLSVNSKLFQWLKSFAWRFMVNQESFFLNLYSTAINTFEADTFVAHDLPMLPVAFKAAKKNNAKLIYDSHELFVEQEYSSMEKKQWRAIEKKYINHADAVMTVNFSIAEELKKRYQLNNVGVIYNAEKSIRNTIDESEKKRFHKKFSIPSEETIILFQGSLSPGRNLVALIESFCFLKSSPVHLVLMGAGELTSKLEKIAQKNNLSHVHFHPAVSQEELLAYTQAADIGIIPYQPVCLNNYYCTPNKLFEFIAAGLPVLASDLPEISKIVNENKIGMVADLSCPKLIAEAIKNMILEKDRLSIWKKNLKAASQRLSWERQEKNLYSIYQLVEDKTTEKEPTPSV